MLDKLVAALNANVVARKLFIQAHALTPAAIKEIGLEGMFGDESPRLKTGLIKDSEIVLFERSPEDRTPWTVLRPMIWHVVLFNALLVTSCG